MKIGPVAAKLLHADGKTDTTKLTVAFRNFTNAPKNTFCPESVFMRLFLYAIFTDWFS